MAMRKSELFNSVWSSGGEPGDFTEIDAASKGVIDRFLKMFWGVPQ
jgi:hypothetical protein